MNTGGRSYFVTPIFNGRLVPNEVRIEVKQFGMSWHETITPQQAREFAAQLLQAANEAEGK